MVLTSSAIAENQQLAILYQVAFTRQAALASSSASRRIPIDCVAFSLPPF